MLIQHFTEKVAAAVAARHVGDPEGELLVWLHTALRREASVGELYGLSNLGERMGQIAAPVDIEELVAITIGNVWAQEKSHAAYLDAVLVAVARTPTLAHRASARIEGVMGAIEGWVMSGRTSPSQLARAKAGVLLAVGRHVQPVPDFVGTLAAMSFREYCLLNADLEVTAVMGYERMLALLAQIADAGAGADGLSHTTLQADLAKLVQDERYHNEVFQAIGDWFDGPGGNVLRPGVSRRGCVTQLAEIRARAYR